jgi:RNA polymerase sigma-70 factor (ECF subfamily)
LWEALRLKPFEELVADAVSGDSTAFAQLLEKEAQGAYRAALAVLGSPESAREAVQEAAIRAWQRLPSLRDPRAWPAWFRRIAVRAALDESRRSYTTREVPMPDELGILQPDPAVAGAEHLSLQVALRGLPPHERALLGLRFGADLTVPDLAAAMGIPLGTAKARLHRALEMLRAAMGDELDGT